MNLETLKQSTSDSREYDNLRQYPISIRQFRQKSSAKFDKPYSYRASDTFLQKFMLVKYPVSDRDFGSPNADFCNIFLNTLNQQETNNIIQQMLEAREWVYHPVRVFEKWNTLSKLYYDNESYFWLILLFNRITDPFRSLQDFNIVRIPNFDFLQRLQSGFVFQFDQAE